MEIREEPGQSSSVVVVKTDLSLRANGETYIEQDSEVAMIFDRIENNSSSVLGIAGARGAGKSSLSLSVLNKCKEKGYFILFIPSPIAYDSKEFLLTIYQTVCEKVKADMDLLFRYDLTLEQIGRNMYSQRRKILGILSFLCVFLSLIVVLFGGNYFKNILIAARLPKKMLVELSSASSPVSLNAEQDTSLKSLQTIYRSMKLGRPDTAFPMIKKGVDGLESLDKLMQARSAKWDSSYFLYQIDSARAEAIRRDPYFAGEWPIGLVVWMGILTVLCALAVVFFLPIKRFVYGTRILKKHFKQKGLATLTEEKIEWLTYQIKLSSAAEYTVPIPQITPKLSKKKEIELRPLSLPGLSNDFNDYLVNVAEVYSKIVICIDELDKIDTPDNMNELLKGVKGVIGKPGTHFLLTVSEDALAKFSSRLSSARDLIESSFEEIYYLPRVSLSHARHILSNSFGTHIGNADKFAANYPFVWFFGNGIPREIKRNLLLLSRKSVDLRMADPGEVWLALTASLLESLKNWAILQTNEEKQAYQFIFCVNEVAAKLPIPADFQTAQVWYNNFLDVCRGFYKMRFLYFVEVSKSEGVSDFDTPMTIFEKAIFEFAVCVFSFQLLQPRNELDNISESIEKIFRTTSFSPLYAAFQFYQLQRVLLQDQGV